MELKEGMYVRLQEFDYTIIAKIVELDKEYDGFKAENDMYYINQNILKSSDNPIDLIEVGDYVNGYKVYEADKVCHRITLNGSDDGNEFRLTYLRPALGKNMGIKSIVTKEQFDSMKYVVGDKE